MSSFKIILRICNTINIFINILILIRVRKDSVEQKVKQVLNEGLNDTFKHLKFMIDVFDFFLSILQA